MTVTIYQNTTHSLRRLYLDDERPWLVGFSGGKDSTMLASLIFDVVLSIPDTHARNQFQFFAPILASRFPPLPT